MQGTQVWRVPVRNYSELALVMPALALVMPAHSHGRATRRLRTARPAPPFAVQSITELGEYRVHCDSTRTIAAIRGGRVTKNADGHLLLP